MKWQVLESRISADADLADLDEEFKESNMELLTRFYKLFDSIHRSANLTCTHLRLIDLVSIQTTTRSL